MKVIVPLNFDEEELMQIAWDRGRKGRATRKMVREWVFNIVCNRFMDIADRQDEEKEER